MKSKKLLLMLILTGVVSSVSCYGNNEIHFEKSKPPVLNISKSIKDSNFRCSPDKDLIEIYSKSTFILFEKENIPKIKNNTLTTDSFVLTGIKKLSKINRRYKDTYEEILSYDIDVFYHNLNILRFAVYGLQVDGTESAGFYYVINGKPQEVSNKLIKAGVDLNYLEIEETPAHHTRIRCTMAG